MIKEESMMNTLLHLIKVPGISGTESENLSGEEIYNMILQMPYFKKNPNKVKKIPVKDDCYNRFFVTALYENPKKTNKTIIITGHTDVVGIDEFGHLKNIAFDAEEFTKRVSEFPLTREVKEDLESEDWLFGRGSADMKYGIALHMEVLREISTNNTIDGNLMMVAVPGEESNSEGMVAAAEYLEKLSKEEGYEFIALLNSECTLPKYDGDTTKKIYLGSCGKIMPLFYFVGKESHVCEPFSGLNPNILASELNKLMEVNVELCDVVEDNITPPPVCLKQKDLKELYSVQLPCAAAAYYNMIYLTSSPEEIVDKLKRLSLRAFQNAINIVNSNMKLYNEHLGEHKVENHIEPKVMTYNELYEKVLKTYGDKFNKELEEKILLWKNQKLGHQNIAINIIRETFEKYPDKTPVIIIGFSPSYYPVRTLDSKDKNSKILLKAVENTIEYAKEKFNRDIFKESYFMGISDLSYTGLNEGEDIRSICSNILGLGYNYNLPIESLEKLNIPSIIFGGFGKDFHKYTERLNLSYSIKEVPQLYEYIIRNIFKLHK
ncbi:M20/M25/M40 family metallo-hydrolase [Hathewaya limosa]|uniref:Arginine utilization protein RocB n=1 Tax=Hathewaya limosa TaxID=1536 RepID=A0ABU0JR57_HATLI|nr:M20/M25/M40 family metallo-hydrolase [Hathewaya limosa]AWZ48885.1 peptidase M20 [Clostridiaceae bacterium 14S0207]MDQ0479563.1 arginine utilization protein RocB [Hathewaya limosa]